MTERDATGKFTNTPPGAMDDLLRRAAHRGTFTTADLEGTGEEEPAKAAPGSFDGGAHGGPPATTLDMESILRSAMNRGAA